MAVNKFLDLGRGVKMPILGLGTCRAVVEEELEQALDTAFELGYRHIDTAFAYKNEHIIGRVLKKWFDSGKLKREDLFITTKLPNIGVHPDRVEIFMKKSLEALQLDYVDLYLIHHPMGFKYDVNNPNLTLNLGEMELEPVNDHVAIWKKMEEQVDAGRTRSIGLSNFNIKQIENILKSARIKPANLQIELHIYLQQRELVEFCHKNGITVVAYATLGTPGFPDWHKNVYKLGEVKIPSLLQDPVVAKIAKKHSKTPAQVLLKFVEQQGIAVIPKSTNPKRLKENIDIFDFELDENDFKELRALDKGEAGRLIKLNLPKQITHPDYPYPRQ